MNTENSKTYPETFSTSVEDNALDFDNDNDIDTETKTKDNSASTSGHSKSYPIHSNNWSSLLRFNDVVTSLIKSEMNAYKNRKIGIPQKRPPVADTPTTNFDNESQAKPQIRFLGADAFANNVDAEPESKQKIGIPQEISLGADALTNIVDDESQAKPQKRPLGADALANNVDDEPETKQKIGITQERPPVADALANNVDDEPETKQKIGITQERPPVADALANNVDDESQDKPQIRSLGADASTNIVDDEQKIVIPQENVSDQPQLGYVSSGYSISSDSSDSKNIDSLLKAKTCIGSVDSAAHSSSSFNALKVDDDISSAFLTPKVSNDGILPMSVLLISLLSLIILCFIIQKVLARKEAEADLEADLN